MHPRFSPPSPAARAESLAVGGGQEGTLAVQGLDGDNITVRPAVAAAGSLPRIGPGGVIVDLGHARTSPDAAGTVPRPARRCGWDRRRRRTPSVAYGRQGCISTRCNARRRSSARPSTAARLWPTTSCCWPRSSHLLVAAVGTFSVLAAGSRQRATEMVALEVTGVRRTTLARSLAIEGGILALTALFGVAAGAGSAAIVSAITAPARRAHRCAAVLCAAGFAPPGRGGWARCSVVMSPPHWRRAAS